MQNKVSTYRPYYIDTDLLFDMYSTLMNGLSFEKEIIEKQQFTKERSGKSRGSASFSIANLATLGAEDSREDAVSRIREIESKSTYTISTCLLLNRVLEKLHQVDGKPLIRHTPYHVARPFYLERYQLGQPFIIEGSIHRSSIRDVEGHYREHANKINRFFSAITSGFMSAKRKQKWGLHTSYCLLSDYENRFEALVSEIRILLDDFCACKEDYETSIEMIEETTHTSETDDIKKQFVLLQGIIEKFYMSLAFDIPRSRIKEHAEELYKAITRIYSLFDQLKLEEQRSIVESLIQKNIVKKLHYLAYILQEYIQYESFICHADIRFSQIRYVFSLKKTMLYNADVENIFFPMHVKCLALLRNVGQYHYEVEIVAIYQ